MGRRKISPDYKPILADDGKPYAWTHIGYVLLLSLEQLNAPAPMMLKKSDFGKSDKKLYRYRLEFNDYMSEAMTHLCHTPPSGNNRVMLANTMRPLDSAVMEESYEDAKKTIDSLVKAYKKMKLKYVNTKYSKMADIYDDIVDAFDYRKGNLIEAMNYAPYIANLMTVGGGAPKVDINSPQRDIDNTIEQLGVVNDLFIDFQHHIYGELKVQYERQEMERTGMNGLQEQTYKEKLYAQHKKVIDVFEKLRAVEDHNQYDRYLNNELAHSIRRPNLFGRDFNFEVGCFDGECRAIENGWGYKDLRALGFVTGMLRNLNAFKADAPADEYNEHKDLVEQAIADLEALKATIWDKKDPTTQEKLDFITEFTRVSAKYADSGIRQLFTNVALCGVMIADIKDDIQNQLNIEKERENVKEPKTYLNNILATKGMRAAVDEMILLTRKMAELTDKVNNNQATEEERQWTRKFMQDQNDFFEEMTAQQKVEYFKALNERQADLQVALSVEAERIEKEIQEGRIEGLGDLKDDPVVRGIAAERIALKTTKVGKQLDALSDIVTGFKMEFEGEFLTEELAQAVNDPSVRYLSDLFSDKAKEEYIKTKAGDNEFRLRHLMARGYDINGKEDFLKAYGVKVDVDGKCSIHNRDKYNDSVAQRATENSAKVKVYNENLSIFVAEACKKLTELSDMKVKPGKDSEEFTNMREALMRVSELGVNNTPAEIHQAVFDLKLCADEYTNNRVNSAENRRDKAAELSQFAKANLELFNSAYGREICINKTVADQLSDSFKFGQAHQSEADIANNKQTAADLKGYMVGFNEYFNNLYTRFDDMKVNKSSDSKQFTAMREALEKLKNMTADNTVKDITDALYGIRKTSAAYISKIEVEGGGKSINGGRRLTFAKELFDLATNKTTEFNAKLDGRLDMNKSISAQAPEENIINLENNNIIENNDIIENNNINRQPSNVKELQEEEGIKENNKVVLKAGNKNLNHEKGINKE